MAYDMVQADIVSEIDEALNAKSDDTEDSGAIDHDDSLVL
jgi:hypothetical protein